MPNASPATRNPFLEARLATIRRAIVKVRSYNTDASLIAARGVGEGGIGRVYREQGGKCATGSASRATNKRRKGDKVAR